VSGRRIVRTLAPAAFLAAGACVATRNDLRLVQNDVALLKAEQALADSARRAQLDRVIAQLGLMSDSLNATTARINRFQGDVRQQMYGVEQQLVTIQELTGQSQRRLQELRASMEQRAAVVPPAAPATGSAAQPSPGTSPGAAAQAAPGPNQLFQLALDQLRRGSTGAARAGFGDLLRQYPTADIAPDAQFYVAEAYAAEGNAASADSVYALVAERYPASMRAGTALYKRAITAQAAGRADDARALFTAVIERFPRSDEAVLARDRLRTLK
jgi:tol-pal system protein YbgF